MELRTLGSIVTKTSKMLDERVGAVQGIRDEAVGTNKDILVLCYDGPIQILGYQIHPQEMLERCARFLQQVGLQEAQLALS